MAEKDKSAEVLETLQSKGDLYARVSIHEQKRFSDLEEAIEHIVRLYYSILGNYESMMNYRALKSKNIVGNPRMPRLKL